MATRLALQRNFVTISPNSQISVSTSQSNSSTTTTVANSATNDEIITITDGNRVSSSETNNAPIHIMQTHSQVNLIVITIIIIVNTPFKNIYFTLIILFGFTKYYFYSKLQKKYILQTGTTSEGVSIIDVVPIDHADSPEEAPITVSTILPANSVASPNRSNPQQITAQVAFVQTQEATDISESKPHFITVNGKRLILF